jgi:hypothetical protein
MSVAATITMQTDMAFSSSTGPSTFNSINVHVKKGSKRPVSASRNRQNSSVLSCHISTPAGHEVARDKGLFTSACPKYVRDVAEILEEMLAE